MNPPLFLLFPPLLSPSPSVPAGRAMCVMPRGERKTYPESLKNWIAIGNKLNHPAEHLGAVKHPFWRPPQPTLWFMTVFLHGASCSQVWQTDAKRHMSQQCFTASIKVVHLHWWALCSLCFYSPPAAQIISVKHRRNTKTTFICVTCAGVCECAFVWVSLYSMYACVCRWTEDVADKSMRGLQVLHVCPSTWVVQCDPVCPLSDCG